MAVSRFDNPAKYTPVDDYVNFPVEYLVSALGVKQKAYDETESTNESSLKSINDLVVLDNVRTNTNNTETTTAVDKQLKNAFVEKINKDILKLTENVNGDLGSSDANRRAKEIAKEVNTFKADFGVKAKARYDNYQATIKGIDASKADPTGIQQGIYNQVNESLMSDYNDFDKTYTSKQNDYLDVEKSIQEAVSIAKADTRDYVKTLDINQRASLAKRLNFRQGYVSESQLTEELSKEKVKQTYSQFWTNKGKTIAENTLKAQTYNDGRKFKNQEEFDKELEKIRINGENYALTGAYIKQNKTQTFNQDAISAAGAKRGYDENGTSLSIGGTTSGNTSNTVDAEGKPIIKTVNTVETSIAQKQKENKDLTVKLNEYKALNVSLEKQNKKADPSITNALQAKIDNNKKEIENEVFVARTAFNTVIETKLPEVVSNLLSDKNAFISSNFISKDFLRTVEKSNNKQKAVSLWMNYDKSGRVGLIDVGSRASAKRKSKKEDEYDRRFDKLMENQVFSSLYFEYEQQTELEFLQKKAEKKSIAQAALDVVSLPTPDATNLTLLSIKNSNKSAFIQNMLQFENALKEESNKTIQKYEANTTSDYIFFGNIDNKKPSKEQIELQKTAYGIFESLPELSNYTIDANYKQGPAYKAGEKKTVVDAVSIGTNGRQFFYNITSTDNDDKTTKEKVILNKVPDDLMKSLLSNAYNYGLENGNTNDAMEQKSYAIRLKYPSLNKLLLQGNGTTYKNLRAVIGKSNTQELESIGIKNIEIQPNPSESDERESLYKINGTGNVLTYQELCNIVFDIHVELKTKLKQQQ